MSTVNLKHFGHVCTQALRSDCSHSGCSWGFSDVQQYGRRCWLLRNQNPDKQSERKSVLHSRPADNCQCTASSKWKQSCPDRLVSRSSLQWCQVHKEALPAARNPERAGSEHQCDWGTVKKRQGWQWQWWQANHEEEKSSSYCWGGCVRCRQQPQWDRMQLKQGAGAAKLPWREGELQILGLQQQWMVPWENKK